MMKLLKSIKMLLLRIENVGGKNYSPLPHHYIPCNYTLLKIIFKEKTSSNSKNSTGTNGNANEEVSADKTFQNTDNLTQKNGQSKILKLGNLLGKDNMDMCIWQEKKSLNLSVH